MKKLLVFAALAAVSALSGCGSKPQLRIFGWADYYSPDVIKSFELKYNCDVIVDTFDSNENMYEALKAGGTFYDIINPSSYHVDRLAKEGLIVELDRSKLPDVMANFDRSFAPQVLDAEFKYSVPYAESYSGLCYLKSKVPTWVDIESWDALDNPVFRGKTTLLDDIREVIGAGLIACGYDINSVNPDEIAAVVEKVNSWKKNSRKFDAESYKVEVPSGASWVAHAYSFDTKQAIHGDPSEGIAPRKDIGFALPKEGFPISFDVLVIASTSQEPDLAHAFINFMYDPENARANMEYIFGPMAVKPALETLDPEIKQLIVLDAETLKRGRLIKPISGQPGAIELYKKAWKAIRDN